MLSISEVLEVCEGQGQTSISILDGRAETQKM